MTHRNDRIRLPASEPRCEPRHVCTMKSRCARYQASVPAHGGSMTDYTLPSPSPTYGGTSLCAGYVNVATLHVGHGAPAPAPVKPAVRGL